jgi:hypothetical protein
MTKYFLPDGTVRLVPDGMFPEPSAENVYVLKMHHTLLLEVLPLKQ